MARKSKGMHKEQIKAHLKMRCRKGITDLSREWGYSRQAISQALNRPWPSVEAKIAKALHKKAVDIWPDRYDRDGNPLGQRAEKKNSRNNNLNNDQIGDAA